MSDHSRQESASDPAVVRWPEMQAHQHPSSSPVLPSVSVCTSPVQFAVPDALDDETAAEFFVNPCTAIGLVTVAAAPKVRACCSY